MTLDSLYLKLESKYKEIDFVQKTKEIKLRNSVNYLYILYYYAKLSELI